MHNEPLRVATGVPQLDELLQGGLPRGSVSVISGPPGSGKTILAQQIAFANASPTERVLSFNTLSEPTAKTLRYLKSFRFFRAEELEASVQFVDLGTILRKDGLDEAAALMMSHLKLVKPSLVIVDSFKVFDDLAASAEQQRKFGYEMAVNLMAWEATALLLGEYGARDFETNPLFSIVDGLFLMSQRELHGENQRFFRTWKLRGTDHSRDEVPFRIGADGVALYASQVVAPATKRPPSVPARCKFGVAKVDELLGEGIPRGSTLLLSGMAGTGKTVFSLEFLYRGAIAGERGLFFSFEETPERLIATAEGLGWDLAPHLASGMVQLIFVPQPDIAVEANVAMMRERVEATGAARVVVDSVSVFLHKMTDAQASREKVFHICSIMQTFGAVALLATDIPSGSDQISRFGVEETVVDGVVLLSAVAEGMERERYIEVYKLRNTSHVLGRHNLTIGRGGVTVYPRFAAVHDVDPEPVALEPVRLRSGVPGFDAALGGGLLRRSVTLLSGSAGAGKTTAAVQFVLEGAKNGERSLYVTLEEGAEQLCASAAALGLPLREAVDAGHVEILHISREQVRGVQFLSVLADRLRTLDASRVVLDALTQMVSGSLAIGELRHLIYRLMLKFKHMGVTTLLTLESNELVVKDGDTQKNLSPIADNLVLLRYEVDGDELVPALTVIKTRGSDHLRGSARIRFGVGGMQLVSADGRPA